MSTKASDKIKAGLEEAIRHAEGDDSGVAKLHVYSCDMSTKDDALIADIARAISGSGVTSPASLRKARTALAVARKAIREEDAAVCSSRAREWADSYGDGSKDWAKRSMISAAEADRCAAAIRSLATQEQHNGD